MEENQEKIKIYQKWWFWVCLVIIVIVLSFVAIMWKSFDSVNSGENGVALQIKEVTDDFTLYSSAGLSTLLLQINLQETDIAEIKNIIVNNYDTSLSTYDKLIILATTGDTTIAVIECSLPNFEEVNYCSYIDLDTYKDLYNTYIDLYGTYDNLFDNYSDLYNYIF